MKRKKAALYSPYLDLLGGGEKYILSILKVLADNNYEPFIFWDTDVSSAIHDRLNIQFDKIQFLPNIFQKKNFFQVFSELKNFDIFLYVTNGSYFFSGAQKNYIYAMYPQKNLYQMSVTNMLKLHNYQFITHSNFTKQYIDKWTGKNSIMLYPALDKEFLQMSGQNQQKEKIILSVGRFFTHLHAKRQDEMIKTFNQFQQQGFLQDFQLVLVGGLKPEDNNYFQELTKLAKNNPHIVLQPNLGYDQLLALYKKASIYWHFAGFGIDEKVHPEQVEHLGISPLEAMAASCIVFAFKAGGPKELITDSENGFLFTNEHELKKKMLNVLSSNSVQQQVIKTAKQFILKNFTQEVFNHQVVHDLL